MESFRDHIWFLKKLATKLRIHTLEAIHNASVGHTGSSLSAIDILVSLYCGKLQDRPIMNYDPKKPGWEGQDYFVLSKGHAAPAWYALLAEVGFFSKDELYSLNQVGSLLQGHPVKKIPGVTLGSGSLAHGFSSAVGLSMALKADKQLNRVFCLLGDGELQEGQVWEAAMSAAHYKLDNLTAVVDFNDLQLDGATRAIMNLDPIADKFESFGWKTIPVSDGHDYEELLYAFERAFSIQRKPSVVIARTIKGKGVSFAENKSFYHGVALSEQEMAEALPKLQAELELLEKTT